MITGFGMGFGGIGASGMILFWVAVIAGIVWLVRTVGGSIGVEYLLVLLDLES